jgi:L-2-hydroxycarboxylate dehydrogenase (NAD+)
MAGTEDVAVRRVAERDLHAFTMRLLCSRGVSEPDAAAVADVLVASDVRGIASHGMARLSYYVQSLENGGMDPRAAPIVVRESATTALIDARDGLGHPVGVRAMTLAIEKAAAHDLGMVTVRHSNHYGIAGYYAMMALPRDMIGISLTNTHPGVAPTGGRSRVYGTNPIAIAVPTAGGVPFVLDMSTSVVPYGRLEVAARRGKTLAEGWALDAAGNPTIDTAAAMVGMLRPLGGDTLTSGYKGYGLGLAVEMLSAVLPGALYGPLVHAMADGSTPSDLGQFFMAINVAAFDDPVAFKERAADLLRLVKQSPRVEGTPEILVAGEKEQRATEAARRLGVPIEEPVVAVLEAMAARCGVPSPFMHTSAGNPNWQPPEGRA